MPIKYFCLYRENSDISMGDCDRSLTIAV